MKISSISNNQSPLINEMMKNAGFWDSSPTDTFKQWLETDGQENVQRGLIWQLVFEEAVRKGKAKPENEAACKKMWKNKVRHIWIDPWA